MIVGNVATLKLGGELVDRMALLVCEVGCVAHIRNFLEMKLRNSPLATKANCGAIELLIVWDIRREKV